ncbi:MAG: DUF1579 domain-containing protein [Phycisphaerales bacterium JB038]
MKHRLAIAVIALIATSLFFVTRAASQSQDEQGSPMGDPAQMQEMMEIWMKFAAPGEPHHAMMGQAGKWNTTLKSWMAGPDGPATESSGEATMKATLGGRWLMERHTSEMMGMPFEGFGVFGYDNYKEQYVGMWVDNMSTAMYIAYGAANEAGDVITMEGTMDEPMTGERDKQFRWVVNLLSDDKHTMEIHDLTLPEGKTKVMEITYERQ